MSKLFISYRRKSWGFTHRLADELRERLDAEVFVDVDSIDQSDFEKSILKHLRQSDAVLLVVSDTTFIDRIHRDDDWVRREIREALTLGLPLVMVNVDGLLPPSGLPDDIKAVARMQGVNFYPEFFTPAVERLTDFVTRVSSVRRKGITGVANITLEPATLVATGTVENPPERQISSKAFLDEALDLLEQGDYPKAIFLLEELQSNGFKSRVLNIEDLLRDAVAHQVQAEHRREAQLDYEEITSLFKRRVTRERGLLAFQNWQMEYADVADELDIENIRSQPPRTSSATLGTAYILSAVATKSSKYLDLMPKPFDWIDIPVGKVTLGGNDGANGGYITKAITFDVASFSIAKYPVTNAQFRIFVAMGGYQHEKWWTNAGWQQREKEDWDEQRYLTDKQLNKLDYPVVGVSWYEAFAFCHWLSEASGENITLPTEQQWQRAAQADTGWAYPYGDQFDKSHCNFRLQHTTSVTQYEGSGDSPFGVVDMSGNVWEWCLTSYMTGENSSDGIDVRVIRGGSWSESGSNSLRVDYRTNLSLYLRNSNVGFRIARS